MKEEHEEVIKEESKTTEVQEPKRKKVPKYTPITCPRCGRREIAFVTEYHKCIGVRVVSYLFIAAAIIATFFTAFNNGKLDLSGDYSLAIIFLALYVICQLIICFTESRTHINAICRECGYVWLYEFEED